MESETSTTDQRGNTSNTTDNELLQKLQQLGIELIQHGKLHSEGDRLKAVERSYDARLQTLSKSLELSETQCETLKAKVQIAVGLSQQVQEQRNTIESLSARLKSAVNEQTVVTDAAVHEAVEQNTVKMMGARIAETLALQLNKHELEQECAALKSKTDTLTEQLHEANQKIQIQSNSKKKGTSAETKLQLWLEANFGSFCTVKKTTGVPNACDYSLITRSDNIRIITDSKDYQLGISLPPRDLEKFLSDVRIQQPEGAILYSTVPIRTSEAPEKVVIEKRDKTYIAFVSVHDEDCLRTAIIELLVRIRTDRRHEEELRLKHLKDIQIHPVQGADELLECLRSLFEYNKFLLQFVETLTDTAETFKSGWVEQWTSVSNKLHHAINVCPAVAKPAFRKYLENSRPSSVLLNAYRKKLERATLGIPTTAAPSNNTSPSTREDKTPHPICKVQNQQEAPDDFPGEFAAVRVDTTIAPIIAKPKANKGTQKRKGINAATTRKKPKTVADSN